MNASLNEKLKSVKWGEFKLGDLFYVLPYKKKFNANDVVIYENGQYPYIVRTSLNNGMRGYLNEGEEFLNEGNTLSFGQDTATVFYQEKPYYTGDKIKILKPKNDRFGRKNALFFASIVKHAFSTFSWGTISFSSNVIEEMVIHLPITPDKKINFAFMEDFIAELKAERVAELSAYLKVSGLDNYELSDTDLQALQEFDNLSSDDWSEFMVGDLFDRVNTKKLPYKAAELPKEPTDDYILPCLTSSFQNQGLNYYVPIENATILSNVISIPSNSDVYRAYYQPNDFTVLSDAYAIRWKKDDIIKLTPEQYVFMVMCINKVTDLPIYSYKNKLGGWNIVKGKYIQLPVKNGVINFDLMDKYIIALKKLAIKDVAVYAEKEEQALLCE